VVWGETPNDKVSSASIAEVLKAGLDADTPLVGNKSGDVKAALAGAAKTVEAVYSYPYQHHVTMEPQNATALYTPEKCEVWAPAQDGEQGLAATAEAAGLPVCWAAASAAGRLRSSTSVRLS
jgi:isoquinoline 1-oxidoreductase beta subunit